MKKFSKILSVILSLALLAGFAAVLVTAEDQTDGITVTVATVTGEKGETVTVPVAISADSNVVSFTGTVTYDSTKLAAVKDDNDVLVSSDIWEGEMASNEDPVGTILVAGAKNAAGYTGEGNLLVLSFEVLEDLTEAVVIDLEFSAFEVNVDGDDQLANVTVVDGAVAPVEKPITTTTTTGTITTETHPTTTTTEKIPDDAVVVKVATVAGQAGDKVMVPINIAENSWVVSFTGEIKYDSAQLKPVEAEYDGEELLVGTEVFKAGVEANVTQDGVLKVAGAKSGKGYSASGALLMVTFEVLEGYTGEADVTVEFSAFQASEDGATDIDTKLYVIPGGVVDELPPDPITTTTTTGTTTTTTEPIPSGLKVEVATVVGQKGDKVLVPITIEENSWIVSFTGAIKYDPAQLKPVEADYDGEELLVGTEIFKAGVEANIAEDGVLKVAGAKSGKGYSAGGALLLVTFEVLDGYTGDAVVTVEFSAFQASEDGATDIDTELYVIPGGVVDELPPDPTTTTASTPDPTTTTASTPDPTTTTKTPASTTATTAAPTAGDNTTAGPDTGDSSNITLYLLLAGAAVVVMAGSVIALKKAQAK